MYPSAHTRKMHTHNYYTHVTYTSIHMHMYNALITLINTNSKIKPFLIPQSLTVSLQGFLNALVYGWTRQDFVVGLNLGNSTLEVS